jgi:site-specific DNA recombinase
LQKIIEQENGAVIYVRVSTDEQAHGPFNLNNQEQRCRDYCKQKGLQVIGTFVDPGQSARSVDRPEFQRMLRFCKVGRREIGYVVVQDLSRFARNLQDQAQTINELRRVNVLVRSTYENNIDETAAGKLAANIFGTFNQYFSDALSEKMQDRTRQSVAAGRFPWRAPIGYVNTGGKSGANIAPDTKRAPLIRRAFELIAAGLLKKSEVLEVITRDGLRATSGKPLSPQTFQAVLRNPLYAGWVTLPSDSDFARVQGLHESIVSQEMFNCVQAVLDGRKATPAPRRKFNPALPLKHLIRCASCDTPLTGGLVKGRTKKYARYWCRKPGCRAVKLPSDQLETEFIGLLRRLRPSANTKSEFPKVAERIWATTQGDIEKRTKLLATRLEDCTRLKRQLLTAKLRGEVSQPDYEGANDDYSAEIAAIEGELRAGSTHRDMADSFVRFAELQLMDIAGAWRIAGPESRQRVQNLLFEGRLHYSPETGILNQSNSSLFTVLERLTHENGMLASLTNSF